MRLRRWTVRKDKGGVSIVPYPIEDESEVIVLGLPLGVAITIVKAHNRELGFDP